MTQISKRYLPPNTQKRMYEIMTKAISKAKGEDVTAFLNDLLSPTEQIMLAKRLSIAYLILKGYTQREISNVLKVSLTTTQKVSLTLNIKGKGYKKLIKSLMKEEKIAEFMNKIADAIVDTIPPAKGTNWSRVRKEREQEKRSRVKPF